MKFTPTRHEVTVGGVSVSVHRTFGDAFVDLDRRIKEYRSNGVSVFGKGYKFTVEGVGKVTIERTGSLVGVEFK